MAEIQTIHCPECGAEISVNEVLHAQIETGLRQQYEQQKSKDAAALAAKTAELAQKAQEIEAARQDAERLIAAQVAERLAAAEQAQRAQMKQAAELEQKAKLDLLQEQLAEKDNKLQTAAKQELEFLKKQAALEERQRTLEAESFKKIEAEKEKIRAEEAQKAAEAQRLLLAQKDKQIADAVKLAEEMKRKAEQGSQKIQGEVLELTLEAMLREAFARDTIAPVPAGVRGADIIQRVYNPQGQECGQIIWESKNTKTWSDGWVEKLKNDQRDLKADVAIIVSEALPAGVASFAPLEGVWVCDRRYAVPLARAIRGTLEAVARERGLAIGKNEKMEVLYAYLTGKQFRQRIEAIVEHFSAMQDDLVKEKRYYVKKWANTEKRLELVLKNTIGMYGDLEAMVALPKIQALELEFSAGEGEE